MKELRPYQKALIATIKRKFVEGKKRVILMSPVGSGKTIMAKSMIRDALEKLKTALFTVHRKVLLEQTYKEFRNFDPSVIMGDDKRYCDDSPLQIGMIQSLINRELPDINLVIIDEVHYAFNSILIQDILKKHPNSFVIGLSATPVDEKGFLLEGFDAIIDDIQTEDLIELGFSVPYEIYSPIQLDLSGVSVKNGDYVVSELVTVVDIPSIVKTVVDNYEKLGQDRKFICFAINQEHGRHLSEEFNIRGIITGYIDATIKDEVRSDILTGFAGGEYQGIVNINVLTAGFDEPSVGCVIIANPSKSWRKYIQECGRGIRLFGSTIEESIANGKPNCILLDLGGCFEEHGRPDKRVKLKFAPKFSKAIDKDLGIDENTEDRDAIIQNISDDKRVLLKKVSSIVDLYDGKVYSKEQEVLEDIIKFLKNSDLFYYRQNSGMAKFGWAIKGSVSDFLIQHPQHFSSSNVLYEFANFASGSKERYVQFTSKAGLPDVTVFLSIGSFYFGIEVKMPAGKLTEHQKETLPNMIENGIFVNFAENVFDVYKTLLHVEENVLRKEGKIEVLDSLYNLNEQQEKYFKKHKLKTYRQIWKT